MLLDFAKHQLNLFRIFWHNLAKGRIGLHRYIIIQLHDIFVYSGGCVVLYDMILYYIVVLHTYHTCNGYIGPRMRYPTLFR